MKTPMSTEILQELTDSVTQTISHVDGVANLPTQSTKLYFDGENIIGFLDLSCPTTEQLETLSKACKLVPSERKDKNNLDAGCLESVGKLNATNLALNFDLSAAGILDRVVKGLLTDESAIRADLYELNLHGVGSFCRPHKHAPRAESMFGSLVLVLPTPHEGGEVILRSKGLPEVRYDFSALFTKQNQPSIIYTAFYGHVEHEVLPVTSGYRVTLVYGLYFDTPQKTTFITSPLTHPFAIALVRALRTPTFLPEGGVLGYGLRREYSVPNDSSDLRPVISSLKGEDASVAKVCHLLELHAIIKVIYEADNKHPSRYPALDYIPTDINGSRIDEEETIVDVLRDCRGAMLLEWGSSYSMDDEDDSDEGDVDVVHVVWVTEPKFRAAQDHLYRIPA
ncbi:hypothetical protein ONZ45_g2560 [Pleurotus djamor]|nr:hypothetical protein ONZ45_g2560 [Pleurotus djamor]